MSNSDNRKERGRKGGTRSGAALKNKMIELACPGLTIDQAESNDAYVALRKHYFRCISTGKPVNDLDAVWADAQAGLK